MLFKIFSGLHKKNKQVQRQIVKVKTRIEKVFDPDYKLYRYSQFDHFADEMDDLYKLIEGSHTIPVPEEVSFEEAASRSLAFRENKYELDKKLLEHSLLVNPTKGTKGSKYMEMFEDGSIISTYSSFRDDSK